MLLRKAVVVTGAAAVLSSWMPTDAHAQGPMDKRTYFTFSQPIALPGVTLQAGTYLFRLADATGSSRVVQVLSEDGSESHAMLFSIPAYRTDVPDDPEIHFMETPSNTPAAVKIWWYPGETTGREFIYPEDQAAGSTPSASTTYAMITTPLADIGHQASTPEIARQRACVGVCGTSVHRAPTSGAPDRSSTEGPAFRGTRHERV